MSIKEDRPETLVGIFVVVGLLILGSLVLYFGRLGEAKLDSHIIYVEFQDASGLIKGSQVEMGGAKIGKVLDAPELTDNLTVMVRLGLDDRVKVYQGSRFVIESISLLGDKMIVVQPPKERNGDALIADGATVMGGGVGGLDALQSDAESVARDARKLMRDARTSLLKLDSVLDDMGRVSGQLSETLGRVNGEVLGDENVSKVKASLVNLEQATASFKKLGKELEPSAGELKQAIVSVKQTADTANATFAAITHEVNELSPSIKELPSTIKAFRTVAYKVDGLVDSVTSIFERVEGKKGLFSALIADHEVGEDAKSFIKNLKKHGLLGYKDDASSEKKDPQGDRFRGVRR